MNLGDLASFVCGKVNQSEAEDILACKGFLKRRFLLLWSHALWKDSLVSYTQTLSPTGYEVTSTWLPTKGVLLVPAMIERVIAVRTDSRKLNVQRPEYYYRIDYDAFSKSGAPTDFLVLPPCVWEVDEDASFFIGAADGADVAAAIIADTLDEDLVGVTRNNLEPADQLVDIWPMTQRVDQVLKDTTTGAITLEAALGGITLVNAKGSQAAVIVGQNTGGFVIPIEQDFTLEDGDEVQMDPGLYISEQGGPAVEIPGGENFRGTITLGASFNDFTFSSADRETVATLAAADRAAKIRQRIRLVTLPSQQLTIRVAGKRSAPLFESDLDSPGLTGCENVLLALAQGDMLQRERHYAKANVCFQEAATLLEQLKAEEVVQMAHEQRVIPECGYGVEEWDTLYGFSF